ncbi:MAG TPA: hypothetical protein VGU45_11835 [Microvirga sp.]|jgi:hypothetical protein|nr:hypothetical protein [Microvirga sp.]
MSLAGSVLIIGPGREPASFSWEASGPLERVKAATDVVYQMAERMAEVIEADTGPTGAVLLTLAHIAAGGFLRGDGPAMRIASLALAAVALRSNEAIWCLTLNRHGRVVRMVAGGPAP